MKVPVEEVASFPEFLLNLANRYGPAVQYGFGPNQFVLISDPAMVQEVIVKKYKQFPKAGRNVNRLFDFFGEKGLVGTVGQEHKRIRKMSQPAFHHRMIGTYGEAMVSLTERVMANWQDGEMRDISRDIAELTLYIVSETLFGADVDAVADDVNTVYDAMRVMQDGMDRTKERVLETAEDAVARRIENWRNAQQSLDTLIDRILDERRQNRNPEDTSLLASLMAERDDDGNTMTEVELADQLRTLFISGQESVAGGIVWTFYLISQHPELEQQLLEEIKRVVGQRRLIVDDIKAMPLMERVIKESMRVFPPAWTLASRIALQDTTIGDFEIAEGTLVLMSPFVLHRKADIFPDPLRFDPDRFLPENEAAMHRFAYLPFGGGARICIGNTFTMMEMHLIVATVLREFHLRMDEGQEIELQAQVTMANKTGMHMHLKKRPQSV